PLVAVLLVAVLLVAVLLVAALPQTRVAVLTLVAALPQTQAVTRQRACRLQRCRPCLDQMKIPIAAGTRRGTTFGVTGGATLDQWSAQ
ncbi:MAG: hypothetical protein CMH98_09485, partial [Oceanospirillaceae bacterium]|nr:hypothetical protein [Oceanospirillaceae bacterium]